MRKYLKGHANIRNSVKKNGCKCRTKERNKDWSFIPRNTIGFGQEKKPPQSFEGEGEKGGIFAYALLVIDMLRGFMEEGYPLYCGARPIDFTADLHEIDGQPIAKRGRITGIMPNPRLQRVF